MGTPAIGAVTTAASLDREFCQVFGGEEYDIFSNGLGLRPVDLDPRLGHVERGLHSSDPRPDYQRSANGFFLYHLCSPHSHSSYLALAISISFLDFTRFNRSPTSSADSPIASPRSWG